MVERPNVKKAIAGELSQWQARAIKREFRLVPVVEFDRQSAGRPSRRRCIELRLEPTYGHVLSKCAHSVLENLVLDALKAELRAPDATR
jgi:hypothetical protein